MGRERVLIVGVSTRAFAESASRAGYPVQSVDAFGDLDQKARVANVALGRDLARGYSAGAAAAVAEGLDASCAAYVANFENHPAAVRRLSRGRRLLGNSPASLARARDVAELAAAVAGAGARVPLTLVADQAGSAPAGKRWLRKPVRGGGGSGVGAWRRGQPLGAGELLQERVDGLVASLAFVADGRRARLLGFAQGLAGDPALGGRGYRYCGSLYPLRPEAALRGRLEALAQALTRGFGLVGVNGVDFVVRDGEVFVLELNPRYTASMELIERGDGPSIFEIHRAGCSGSLPQDEPTPPADVLGKGILWARRDLRVGDTRGWLSRDDVRDVPAPGDLVRRGHPVCSVFARGRDATSCYAALVAAGAALEREDVLRCSQSQPAR
jgi:uncharacterized protein